MNPKSKIAKFSSSLSSLSSYIKHSAKRTEAFEVFVLKKVASLFGHFYWILLNCSRKVGKKYYHFHGTKFKFSFRHLDQNSRIQDYGFINF